jgi:hypothetical protein
MILFSMASGIPGNQILLFQVTLIETGLAMMMIERAPREDGSMWKIILWLG